MSELEKDGAAGLNGGFEVVKNGLPVNWVMYTPKTVPDADFEILLDENEYKEGSKSLRFDVSECKDLGGWQSPGLTSEFFEVGRFTGPAHFRLSFWYKNSGSRFSIHVGSVENEGGKLNKSLKGDEWTAGWQQAVLEVDVPKGAWLRLQLNILSPGTFWIDDVQIDKR